MIRLTLQAGSPSASSPAPAASGGTLNGAATQAPDTYTTPDVIAEADLDLAGVNFQPNGPVGEPLQSGETATFRWSVKPTAPGSYAGTAWLFLNYTDKATGAQSRRAISAQPVEIQSVTLFGLGGGPARLIGAIGAVVGVVLVFPSLMGAIRWFWGRRRGPLE